MAECIEREALLNNRPERRNPGQVGKEEYNKGWNDCRHAFFECIEEEPAADVVEVVHSRWETIPGTKNRKHCTNCDFSGPEYIKFYDYCPNCGARMDGDVNA